VGNDDGATALIGPNTRVVELDGKMMLPGFQDADWIVGAGWYVSTFSPSGLPHKSLLDEISPEIPITLLSNGAHSVWANSAAIERAGISGGRAHRP